jgi:hypothetical protein
MRSAATTGARRGRWTTSSTPDPLPYEVAVANPGDTIAFASGLSCSPASPITPTGTITIGVSLTPPTPLER